jgi:putative ABC transport system permease protein
MSSIILGIAALVAINSFNNNLVRDIDAQAAGLLGADLAITGNRPLTEDLQLLTDSLDSERAEEIELFSMSYISKTDASQFVMVKAIEGGFPFYGKILTEPEDAYLNYQENDHALVDHGLMLEHKLEVGDSIKLGTKHFYISGRLKSAFGSIAATSSFAPAVYIGKKYLAETNLIQPGSMLDYAYYFKLDDPTIADSWEETNKDQFRNESLRVETIEERKENLDEAFSSLNNFLNLIALVSLLLGCIGVASSILIYVKQKVSSIAVFRCLGMTSKQAMAIYIIQIFGLGLLSVMIGAALGSIIQVYLPVIFKDFLPYEVVMTISWKAILEGILAGLAMAMLFALAPLLGIRKISPLRTLRTDMSETGRDPLKILVYILIVVGVFLFLFQLTKDLRSAAVMSIGLLASFLMLYGFSIFMMWAIKKFFPRGWNFVFRQGLSNLYRPDNQTKTLLVSMGLGTAVLTTLFIIQGLILKNVDSMDAGNQPNMVLYGIEKKQEDELKKITEEFDLPVIQQAPIVTMRVAGWKGKSKEEWLADTTRTARRWAINREARVSYRDYLEDDEELLRGSFTGEVAPGDSILISLDEGYAESLDVDLGDEITWNIQGTMMTTYVGSIRDIEFRSMRTRFFILFPNGVLEKAPQFLVFVTKSPNTETTAAYRSKVVKTFPNVSVVDLGMILTTLNGILTKVSYIVKFMAGFSIMTGLIVLISSLLLSKFQRVKESVLLRTIGASKNQILKINATEYGLLGSLAAITGIGISLIASYFLATRQFELDFSIEWWPLIAVFLFITGMTILIGLLNSRDVVRKSPLEVLRREA